MHLVFPSGYDGGDCCDCTCVSTAQTTCGEEGIGFDCRDPDASCVDKGTIESSFCVERFMGDGDCDFVNNDEECGEYMIMNACPGRGSS